MDHSPAFLRLVSEAKKGIRETDVKTIKARLAKKEKFLLIDTREDHEWSKGRLPSAVHMGRGVLERDIEQAVPDKGTEMVLYCGGGFRSALSAESLQKMGYTNVVSMDGGFRGWVEAGGDVQK